MTGERELQGAQSTEAPSLDLPSVGPSYEPERVLQRRREREAALQTEQAIVPVGKRVAQVLGGEYIAEIAAERRSARAQRQAEQGLDLSLGRALDTRAEFQATDERWFDEADIPPGLRDVVSQRLRQRDAWWIAEFQDWSMMDRTSADASDNEHPS